MHLITEETSVENYFLKTGGEKETVVVQEQEEHFFDLQYFATGFAIGIFIAVVIIMVTTKKAKHEILN